MSVQFRCPCGAMLRSSESIAGKKINCPKCGKQLQIKSAGADPSTQKAVTPAVASPGPSKQSPSQLSVSASLSKDEFDWDTTSELLSPSSVSSNLSSYSTKLTGGSGKTVNKAVLKWIAIGVGATFLICIAGLLMLNRKSSISASFKAAQSTTSGTASGSSPVNLQNDPTSNSIAGEVKTAILSGSVGPETIGSSSPALKLAEEFASYARQGSADRALKMIAVEDFDKRLKNGPTASWEAIMKNLETPRVLGHLRNKSLEGTPMDEGFRHWRVLGETLHEGQPAVLLRYYSDPEYPRQLISNSDKMLELTQVITQEEFKENAKDLVLYRAKDRNLNAAPSMPDAYGFLPPRVGYLMLILDNTGANPRIVDIVSVLGQVPMSQIAGLIFLTDYQVIQIGSGSESEYKSRIDRANAVGKKSFSFFGMVPNTSESTGFQDSIQSPALWFRPPENVAPDFKAQNGKVISEWLANHEPSRTSRLIRIANALNQSSSDAAIAIADFKKQYPGDPGADLAVISYSMTSLEPRMPEESLSFIEESAESLYKTFNDPFMLYVRGLVCQVKGDQATADRFMQQANNAGFVCMRMLRKPFEQGVQSGEKDAVLAALKQIGAYWSSKAELDKSSNAEGRFGDLWTTAKNKADGVNSHLVQRDAISGGLGRRDPGRNPENSALGSGGPPGMQSARSRAGSDPNSRQDPLADPIQREPGFAGPRGSAGLSGPGGPNRSGPPSGFPQPPEASSDNLRFILQSKTAMDPNAILEKLKERLKTGNFQMSHSGNNATITLGFAGPLEEAVKAVDFGKVTKKDEATRTIHVELP